MWGKKIRRFDAGVWSGQLDLTRALVALFLLGGLAMLWLSIANFVRFQI
jgi:hypothetical protein